MTIEHMQTAYERKVLQSFAKWNNGEYVETDICGRIYSQVLITHDSATAYITYSHIAGDYDIRDFATFRDRSGGQYRKSLTNSDLKGAIDHWRQTKKIPGAITY